MTIAKEKAKKQIVRDDARIGLAVVSVVGVMAAHKVVQRLLKEKKSKS